MDNKVSTSIKSFFKKYRISAALRLSNAYKSKGIPVISIFEYLFCMIFTNRSMYMNMLMGTNQAGFKKDTVYRFLNSIHINWIRFTTWLSAQIINETITGLTSDKRVNVLIVDDSLFERSSSKKVELLAKVYDHAKKTYKYGFRLLTLGWSDGNTFLPVNGCLLSTENQKNRINEAITMDKRSAGYLRRNLAQTKATAVVLELIKAAKKAMIPASYVLFDTWFCSPSSLIAIKKMGYDIIAMAKKTSKMHYLYNGIMQPLTAIYKQNRKRRGRSRYLLSVEVSLEKDGKSIPARIVFVRNKNKRKDYLALITTDMNLNEDEIIRIYGKRWDIEVFFKVCKSYLKLGKGCNSLSYDAMTAHTAIVFTRYMMLALENRRSSDLRTMGEIFYYIQDEMSDITLIQAFHLLMQVFLDTIADKLSLTSEQLDQLLNAFMAAIPKELKERLPKCA
ncbi:IS4 family transposase [Thermoanaerobacterium thermosaccharolyticum]|uniref:IS4 family transposase n=1 Tax=Thermoanaerobacterium thermosaccharolyticum TaxID=1517 RepID=UPI003DA81DEA